MEGYDAESNVSTEQYIVQLVSMTVAGHSGKLSVEWAQGTAILGGRGAS